MAAKINKNKIKLINFKKRKKERKKDCHVCMLYMYATYVWYALLCAILSATKLYKIFLVTNIKM